MPQRRKSSRAERPLASNATLSCVSPFLSPPSEIQALDPPSVHATTELEASMTNPISRDNSQSQPELRRA